SPTSRIGTACAAALRDRRVAPASAGMARSIILVIPVIPPYPQAQIRTRINRERRSRGTLLAVLPRHSPHSVLIGKSQQTFRNEAQVRGQPCGVQNLHLRPHLTCMMMLPFPSPCAGRTDKRQKTLLKPRALVPS